VLTWTPVRPRVR